MDSRVVALAFLFLAASGPSLVVRAQLLTHTIQADPEALTFNPSTLLVFVGEEVVWEFQGAANMWQTTCDQANQSTCADAENNTVPLHILSGRTVTEGNPVRSTELPDDASDTYSVAFEEGAVGMTFCYKSAVSDQCTQGMLGRILIVPCNDTLCTNPPPCRSAENGTCGGPNGPCIFPVNESLIGQPCGDIEGSVCNETGFCVFNISCEEVCGVVNQTCAVTECSSDGTECLGILPLNDTSLECDEAVGECDEPSFCAVNSTECPERVFNGSLCTDPPICFSAENATCEAPNATCVYAVDEAQVGQPCGEIEGGVCNSTGFCVEPIPCNITCNISDNLCAVGECTPAGEECLGIIASNDTGVVCETAFGQCDVSATCQEGLPECPGRVFNASLCTTPPVCRTSENATCSEPAGRCEYAVDESLEGELCAPGRVCDSAGVCISVPVNHTNITDCDVACNITSPCEIGICTTVLNATELECLEKTPSNAVDVLCEEPIGECDTGGLCEADSTECGARGFDDALCTNPPPCYSFEDAVCNTTTALCEYVIDEDQVGKPCINDGICHRVSGCLGQSEPTEPPDDNGSGAVDTSRPLLPVLIALSAVAVAVATLMA